MFVYRPRDPCSRFYCFFNSTAGNKWVSAGLCYSHQARQTRLHDHYFRVGVLSVKFRVGAPPSTPENNDLLLFSFGDSTPESKIFPRVLGLIRARCRYLEISHAGSVIGSLWQTTIFEC